MKEYIKSRTRILGADSGRTMLSAGLALMAVLVLSSVVGSAMPTFISSQNVLVINRNSTDPTCGVGSCGIIAADYLLGGAFAVPTLIKMDQIDRTAFVSASGYDTVILFEVNNADLTASQTSALVSFVTGGGKLIIKDADAVSVPNGVPINDYSWLPANLIFSTSGPGPFGFLGGGLTITETNALTSVLTPADITALNTGFDAVGDANVVKTNGTDWCEDMNGTNGLTPPVSGPIHMYSRLGGAAGSGFIAYAAFDNDPANDVAGNSFTSANGIASSLSGGNQLKMILQSELELSNTSNLPCKVPVVSPSFTVTKDFRFTDVNFSAIPAGLGTLLPTNGSNFNVSYVTKPKDGTVSSTNPGQLYGVVTVNGTGVQNITIADTFGTQFVVNPAHIDGGVDVLRVNTTTGVATVITDTQVTASTVSATGPVDLTINLTTPLASDETVMVYIKYKTSLKGMPPDYSDFVNTANVTTNLGGPETAMATINFVPHA